MKCPHCGHETETEVIRSVVVDQPDRVVAAPCTISGCHYDELKSERDFWDRQAGTEHVRADQLAKTLERALPAHVVLMQTALEAIAQAARDDEKGEWFTLRKWCDDRDIFNDDIQGGVRLISIVAKAALGS